MMLKWGFVVAQGHWYCLSLSSAVMNSINSICYWITDVILQCSRDTKRYTDSLQTASHRFTLDLRQQRHYIARQQEAVTRAPRTEPR